MANERRQPCPLMLKAALPRVGRKATLARGPRPPQRDQAMMPTVDQRDIMTKPHLILIATLASLLATPACAQSVSDTPPNVGRQPPPHVEYEPPLQSVVVHRHECPSSPVHLEIEASWSLSRPGQVRVAAYSGAAGQASETDLARWNYWLTDLTALSSVEVTCQAGGNESIVIHGLKTGRRQASVAVWWWQGRLGWSGG